MTRQAGTVIFWGAGATATLGMRTTVKQAEFILNLAPIEKDLQMPLLRQRVCNALGGNAIEPWISAFVDLLTILGDGDEKEHNFFIFTPDQMNAMRRNWRSKADDDEIRSRIITLRTLYDWPALKAVINVCPVEHRSDQESTVLNLTDLFNVLDMHGQSGHGFRVTENEFLTPQRVTGARNALKILLQAMFYVDWQQLRSDSKKRKELEHHYNFAESLGRRMQKQGLERAGYVVDAFDSKKFYMGDISFASMNYDPIAFWLQCIANRNLNQSPNVPHVGIPARRLQIFHDLGHFVPSTRVSRRNPETLWHPMNEPAAQRLNDPDHGASDCIRISKFLFPHGCLGWRECPNCGKLSAYSGDRWEMDSPVLIPPPPLKAFVQNLTFSHEDEKESQVCKKGGVDARACVNCKTLTYAHHTQVSMQSNFKGVPPPFIEEIQRDLRVIVQEANHIVFMGYSLPHDDVNYRAFFAARRRRDPDIPVKCSIVVGACSTHRSWIGPSELSEIKAMGIKENQELTLREAQHLFGRQNVRFYGGGIPNVLLDGGKVTDSAVDRLLNWNDTHRR